jgi:hypothetical protein
VTQQQLSHHLMQQQVWIVRTVNLPGVKGVWCVRRADNLTAVWKMWEP